MEDNIGIYLAILEEAKQYIGLSDWDIYLSQNVPNIKDTYAETEYDIYEKRLVITLTEMFFDVSFEDKVKILIHELIHARLGIFKEEKQKITEYLEEQFVNDITKLIGFSMEKYLNNLSLPNQRGEDNGN